MSNENDMHKINGSDDTSKYYLITVLVKPEENLHGAGKLETRDNDKRSCPGDGPPVNEAVFALNLPSFLNIEECLVSPLLIFSELLPLALDFCPELELR